MTKGRFFVGLLILAGLSYAGLFYVDRWNADVVGTITGFDVGADPELGRIDLVKVQTSHRSHDNPTGEVILILTAKTEILQQEWSRARTPVYDTEFKPGQKVIANYSSLRRLPTVPPTQTAREIVIMKW